MHVCVYACQNMCMFVRECVYLYVHCLRVRLIVMGVRHFLERRNIAAVLTLLSGAMFILLLALIKAVCIMLIPFPRSLQLRAAPRGS